MILPLSISNARGGFQGYGFSLKISFHAIVKAARQTANFAKWQRTCESAKTTITLGRNQKTKRVDPDSIVPPRTRRLTILAAVPLISHLQEGSIIVLSSQEHSPIAYRKYSSTICSQETAYHPIRRLY
jgi:hypothetical protein